MDRSAHLLREPGREGPSASGRPEAGAATSLGTELLDQACPEGHTPVGSPVLGASNSPLEILRVPKGLSGQVIINAFP